MHAGVNYRQIPPERMDEAVRTYRDSTLPEAQTHSGFKGALILADRNASKIIAIAWFETEANLRERTPSTAVDPMPEDRRCASSTRSAPMIGPSRN